MRIAMIGPKSIPAQQGGGGIERHVEELGARLQDSGHDVTVYVRRRFIGARTSAYRGMALVGIWSVVTKHFDTFSYTLLASAHALFRPYDVIHYHGIGPATLAWVPRLFKPKCRVIVTFHSLDRFHKKWGFFARLFLRFAEWAAVAFPHETIVVSHGIERYVRTHFGKKTIYIPNGTTVRPYPGSDMLSKWGLKKDDYFLTVSRFVPQKGIHYLIEAFLEINTKKKLVLVGSGDIDDRYERLIRSMGAGHDAILFTGFQSGRALAELYANAYACVHPSEAEGLSLSILEAMAAGQCVLVSDIPENIEVAGEAGVIFHSADVDDLRAKLLFLLDHSDIVAKKGKESLARVKKVYTWGGIVRKTESVYQKK